MTSVNVLLLLTVAICGSLAIIEKEYRCASKTSELWANTLGYGNKEKCKSAGGCTDARGKKCYWGGYARNQERDVFVSTDKKYEYRNIGIIVAAKTSIQFSVQACNDAHIFLSENRYFKNGYEIVIGGWANKKSAIRIGKQTKVLDHPDTPGIINCNEKRQFWISWENDFIKVGRSGEDSFMSYLVPKEHAVFTIKRIGVSTGWGSSGEFAFRDVASHESFLTSKTKRYLDLGRKVRRHLEFTVRAGSDIHVSLSTEKLGVIKKQHYEIIIAGWKNTKSIISDYQVGKSPKNTAQVDSPFASSRKYVCFWIRWNEKKKTIYVGRGRWTKKSQAFMTYVSAEPLRKINYAAFSTGWGYDGKFFVESKSKAANPPQKITVGTNAVYAYRDIGVDVQGKRSFTFDVQACHNAHVALSEKINDFKTNTYEIAFGAWSNTGSAIKLAPQSPQLVSTFYKDNIVDCKSFKSFWISWSEIGLQVGEGKRVGRREFMSFAFRNPAERHLISRIGVSTGWGSSGLWNVNFHKTDDVILTTREKQRVFSNLDLSKETSVVFRAKALHDVQVYLSEAKEDSAIKTYRVIIGGWGGTKSTIDEYFADGKTSKLTPVVTKGVTSASVFTNYWVSWSDGFIRAGTGDKVGMNTLVRKKLAFAPFKIRYAGFTTAWGQLGEYLLSGPFAIPCNNANPDTRKEAGWAGIGEALCRQRGGCFDNTTPNVKWCFQPQF